MADDYLSQGIAALRAGNKREAHRLLTAATLAAPNDERAWGLLYDVAENDDERMQCVKEFLRISPNDENARKKYDELTRLRFLRSARSPQTARAATASSVGGRGRETAGRSRSSVQWIVLGSLGGIVILGAAVVALALQMNANRTPPAAPVSGFPSLSAASPLPASAAKSTSLPARLSTPTPASTSSPLFTSSPLGLSAGSSFVAQNRNGEKWEIRALKSETARTLVATFSPDMESSAGRFAIIYLEVTNRGLSPGSFSAEGFLDVQDASGRKFEVNQSATFLVQARDGIDLCTDISPGTTRTCVGVYDISKESDYYRLVPSALADPNTRPVLLEIP